MSTPAEQEANWPVMTFEQWCASEEAETVRTALKHGLTKMALAVCFSAGEGSGIAQSIASMKSELLAERKESK